MTSETCFRRVRGRPSPWGRALTLVWASRSRESSLEPSTSYSRGSRTGGRAPRRRAPNHLSLKSAPSSWRWVAPCCCVCACVTGWIHINSNQMGQNKETRGSARRPTNRKWQCDDRWPEMCALNNVSHYHWRYCSSLQRRRWIRARDERRKRCLCSNNEIIWQVIISCRGFWQGNV